MLKHFRHLLAAASLAALVVIPPAFAGSGGKNPSSCVSAVCVYTEPGVTGAGGPSNGSTTTAEKPVKIPATVTKKLRKYGGKDKEIIGAITKNPGLGPIRTLATATSGPVAQPDALGAAFDAGSGLTILVAVLLGTVVGIAAFGGVRLWRQHHT